MAESRAISTISTGDASPWIVNVVIEIPRGSAMKYEYDERRDQLRLDATNRSSLPFPADYGFIPRARSEDGDLLDSFVLGSGPTVPGDIVRARPIGLLDMTDDAGRDQKILAVALDDLASDGVTKIGDLDDGATEAIERFLREYKRQNGQRLILNGWCGRQDAHAAIDAARARYARPG